MCRFELVLILVEAGKEMDVVLRSDGYLHTCPLGGVVARWRRVEDEGLL